MSTERPDDRIRVRRLPKRGAYDRATIDAILDEGLIAHVGFVVDGQPFVIPTLYARDGDRLLVHGSAASRMLTTLRDGVDICVTVTIADALIIARSAFEHSMNYRSVVVLGRARAVEEADAKMDALRALTEHLIPGRWDDCRTPDESELKATLILELPIDEASAKIRTGGPVDKDPDHALDYWAGILPFKQGVDAPVPDDALRPGIEIPDYVKAYTRRPPRRG